MNLSSGWTGSKAGCQRTSRDSTGKVGFSICLKRTARAFGGMASKRWKSCIASGGRSFHSSPKERRRSEEHTSGLQSLMRITYAVFCLQKKKKPHNYNKTDTTANTTEPNTKSYTYNP